MGACMVLVHLGVAQLSMETSSPVLYVISAAVSLLLLAGLWTPLAGAIIAADELGIALTHPGDPWIHLMILTKASRRR